MKKPLIFNFYFLIITFFSLNISGEETNSERQKYQVVIVGAGIAGLAAATHLLKNNVTDILILEASNRIGGRVYTAPFADFLIEYGAQWIHGQDGNPVYEIAKKYNVTDVQHMEYSFRFIKSATSKINMSIINQFAHETLDYFQDDEELIACNCSLYSYFNKRYEKLVKDNNIDEYTAQALKDIMVKFEASHDGTADLDKVGTWGLTQYKMTNGSLGVAWKSGYHSFINMLLGKYEDEELPVISKTRFNEVVKRVDWSKDEVDLLLEDGTHYFADHVILTVSIGVLKHSAKTMFNPPLPERKLSAIEKLGFDIVNKIFIQFDTRWWPLDFDYNINMLWSDEDKELFKRQSKYGGWITDLLGFHFVENQPRVLEGWISGDTARKTEQLSDKEITDAVMELLHWYLGDKYNISNPINMTRSSWASNKFIRGSYSFRTVESDYQGYFASDISQPIFNNRSIPIVMFAGEATHDHFYSTVHGALETGWREAKRLLALS